MLSYEYIYIYLIENAMFNQSTHCELKQRKDQGHIMWKKRQNTKPVDRIAYDTQRFHFPPIQVAVYALNVTV